MKHINHMQLIGLLLGLSLIASTELSAASFEVLTADDAGAGSLRQAIIDANTNGPGADTITFESGFFSSPRTIGLQSALPQIVSGLSLEGPGANLLTVSRQAGPDYSILSVGFTDNNPVSISDVTLSNGYASGGGGIRAEFATVNLLRVVVTENFADVGGGIYFLNCNGSVVDSTISVNIADEGGGGIRFEPDGDKTLTIINSTISGNQTTELLGGEGSAIYFVSAAGTNTLDLTSSTIASNTTYSSGTAVAVESPDVQVSNLNIRNTIFSNPLLPAISVIGAGTNNISSLGYNLLLGSGGGYFVSPGDQINTDPMLGPLRNNGGATTTHQLLDGSPARDAGDSSGASFDQRGFTRPVDLVGIASAAGGDGADIGAVEMRSTVVTNDSNSSVTGSLRRVIEDINLNGPGLDVVTFDPAFFNVKRTIKLQSELPAIATDFELVGPGSDLLTIRRNTVTPFRILTIAAGVSAAIRHVSLQDGKTDVGGFGGAIYSSSFLELAYVTLAYNQTYESGGAVYLAGAGGDFSNCTMHNNTAKQAGSAILAVGTTGTTLSITNCTISGNIILGEGGGSVALASFTAYNSLNISSSTIAFNHGGAGGGVSSFALSADSVAYLSLLNTIVANNDGPQLSTGVQDENATATIESISHSLVSDDGGGFMTAEGDQINTDPRLAPLGSYGGTTLTHALLNDSPAIDQGRRFFLSIDQRSLPRPWDFPEIDDALGGDGADIGAFEVQAVIQVLNDNDTGAGSLRQAITDAVANGPGVDDIFFDRSFFQTARTIDLQSELPPMSSGLNLIGPGADRLTVRRDSVNPFGIFSSPNGWRLNVSGMSITNGEPNSGVGGGIFSKGDLTLTEVAIRNNTATVGAGVFASEGFSCNRCEFSNNVATDVGGGFANIGAIGDLVLSDVTFSGNTALGNESSAQGGAMYLNFIGSGDVKINSSTFVGNMADAGSAIFLQAESGGTVANVQLHSVLFSANNSPAFQTSEVNGGAAAVTSTGYNLSDDNGEGLLTQPTDLTNTDPQVKPLGNYGGSTLTHLPRIGSPALDAGHCAGPKSWDQRYRDRVFDITDVLDVGGGCDIGAVELNPTLDYPETIFSNGFEILP